MMRRGRVRRRRYLPDLGGSVGDHRDAGASSVEYGLIVFAIAAAMTVALFALGPQVYGLFDHTCQTIANAAERPTPEC